MPSAKAPTPFKLNCMNVNRDMLDSWYGTIKSYCKQSEEYIKYLPGGANAVWTAECRDLTRGLLVAPQIPEGADADERTRLITAATAASEKLRRDLATMLTTVASFCPDGMFRTVVTESTSLDWILTRVMQACNVQTSGRYLPSPYMLEWNRDVDTPALFFMKMKSAFSEALLPATGRYHGERLTEPEAFTPLSESLIVLRWLQAINPALPMHIQETRGSLFTDATPTFADVQPELCNIMESLLKEIEGKEVASRLQTHDAVINQRINAYGQARWGNGARGRGGFGQGQGRRGGMQNSSVQDRRPVPKPRTIGNKSCTHCRYTNKKDEAVWSNHDTNDCFDLYPEKRPPRGNTRVRYLHVPVHLDNDDAFDMSEAATYLETYQAQSHNTDNPYLQSYYDEGLEEA